MVYNGTAYEVKWSAQRDLVVGKSLAGSRLLMATLGGNTKTLLPDAAETLIPDALLMI